MMRGNTIRINLEKKTLNQAEESLYQGDYGQRLIIEGLDLPSIYTVHFGNSATGENKAMVGDETGVDIPDEYLATGEPVHVWVFLHAGEDDGETERHGIIKVIAKGETVNEPPTPAQQSALDTAITALESGVAAAQEAQAAAEAAKTAAEGAAAHYPYVDNTTGNWMVWDGNTGAFVDTGYKAVGTDGQPGVGITNIEKTSTSGLVDTYTITFSNGNDTTFTVTNGSNGLDGQDATPELITVNYSDLTFPVAKDTQCYHDGLLYYAKQDIQTSEAWTAAHWQQTTVEEQQRLLLNNIEGLEENAVIVIDGETTHTHNNVNGNIKIYPNEYTQTIPIRYAKSKDLFESIQRSSGLVNGVTTTNDGRFMKLSGTGEGGRTLFQITSGEAFENLKGKTVNVCLFIKKATGWGNSSYLQLYDGSSNLIKANFTSGGTEYIGWTLFQNISIRSDASQLMLKFSSLNGSSFTNGDYIWFAAYQTVPTITDKIITDEPEEIEVTSLFIDTMMHESSVKKTVKTKEYVDEHTPDIIGYWTEKVYALPEDFGAVGNGIADDGQALADCIAYAIENKKAVRGFNSYKTSEEISLTGRNIDVFLNEIIYTGNDTAVEIRNMYIKFDFHRISSTAKGITFGKHPSDSKYASYCRVTGNEISSAGDCMYIEQYTYYNTVDIRHIVSANGNCITSPNGAFGEYVFRSSACKCPNGYVGVNLNHSKLYDFTIEGDCKYGLLDPMGCVCIGFRHREQVDKMRMRIFHEESNTNGPLLIFTKPINNDGTYAFKYISADTLPWYSIDTSAIQSYADIASGSGQVDVWTSNAFNGSELGTPIRGNEISARYPMCSKMFFISNYKVCVPEVRYPSIIDIAECDFTLLDSNTDADIKDANDVIPYLATDMTIGISHADIYFNSYFGAVGFNDLTITQENGNTCTIYDKKGSVLWDGTNEGDGVWSFKCVMDKASKGRFQGATQYWCYDGTNEEWIIEKIQ